MCLVGLVKIAKEFVHPVHTVLIVDGLVDVTTKQYVGHPTEFVCANQDFMDLRVQKVSGH